MGVSAVATAACSRMDGVNASEICAFGGGDINEIVGAAPPARWRKRNANKPGASMVQAGAWLWHHSGLVNDLHDLRRDRALNCPAPTKVAVMRWTPSASAVEKEAAPLTTRHGRDQLGAVAKLDRPLISRITYIRRQRDRLSDCARVWRGSKKKGPSLADDLGHEDRSRCCLRRADLGWTRTITGDISRAECIERESCRDAGIDDRRIRQPLTVRRNFHQERAPAIKRRVRAVGNGCRTIVIQSGGLNRHNTQLRIWRRTGCANGQLAIRIRVTCYIDRASRIDCYLYGASRGW